MNRVAQHPVQAFVVALGAVAVLSIMDAVMKHLVLAIGIVAVSVWRALANLVAQRRALSARPQDAGPTGRRCESTSPAPST